MSHLWFSSCCQLSQIFSPSFFVFVEIMVEDSVVLARCCYVGIFCFFIECRSLVFMKINCLYQHCIVFGMLNLVINYEINKVKIN